MFQFKIDPKQFQQIKGKVTKDINDILAAGAFTSEVGEMVVDRLRYQTRIRKPFNSTGSLPDLKDSTIAKRRYLAKYNTTWPTFSAPRSNLTIIGAFLNSLTHVVTGPGRILIHFVGTHPGYRTRNGHTKEIENETLAGYLAKIGFTVFDRSIGQNAILKTRVSSIVKRYLRRGLRVKSNLS